MADVERLDRPGMRLVLAAGAADGRIELIEDSRALGDGPPAHVHRVMDEIFYVLEGAFRFERDREAVPLTAGSSIFVPHGSRHRFEATSALARILVVVTPPGLAAFLQAQGELLATGLKPRAAMEQLSARFDVHPVD